MKQSVHTRLLICWLLLLASTCASAQKDSIVLLNVSLIHPEKPLMYTRVNNVLLLKGQLPGDNIRIERSAGPITLRPGTSLSAVLQYDSKGTDTIRVFADELLVLEKTYTVETSGPLSVRLSKQNKDTLTAEELCNAGGLEWTMPGTDYRPASKITGARITVQLPHGKRGSVFRLEGNRFSPEIINHFKTLNSGSTILFDECTTNKQEDLIQSGSLKVILR